MVISSSNSYKSLEYVVGDSPGDLTKALRAVCEPIQVIAIVPYGTRHVAYYLPCVTESKPEKKQNLKILKGE